MPVGRWETDRNTYLRCLVLGKLETQHNANCQTLLWALGSSGEDGMIKNTQACQVTTGAVSQQPEK